MRKYIVINGEFRPGYCNAALVSTADTLEEAKNICNINITEDFSDDSVEEFFAAADPNINEYQDDGKADNVLVYSVEFDDYEHAESYKVYRINV